LKKLFWELELFKMLSTLVLIVAFVASAYDYNIVIENKGEDEGLGLYFVGNPDDEEYIQGSEAFTDMISIGTRSAQRANFGDRFVVRGPVRNDFPSFRLGVTVQAGGKSTEGMDFPYAIQFQAIGLKDTAAVELKHRGPDGDEFRWIEAGHIVSHLTTPMDEFVVRDKNNKEIAGVTIFDVVKDEL